MKNICVLEKCIYYFKSLNVLRESVHNLIYYIPFQKNGFMKQNCFTQTHTCIHIHLLTISGTTVLSVRIQRATSEKGKKRNK